MSKYYSRVSDALSEMQGTFEADGSVKLNRFNKKKFSDLMAALANDPEFTQKVARSVNQGNEAIIEEVAVSKEFRNWCRKLVERCGVDKDESKKVMDPVEFPMGDMSPIYDLMCSAMIEYMNAGNYFSLPSTPDFNATLYTKKVKKKKVTKDAYTPGKADERKYIGCYETIYDDHRELGVKSSCPSYLKKKKKIK